MIRTSTAPLKLLFIDVETTGKNPDLHGIHAIGSILDIDGKETASFYKNVKPQIGAQVDPEALKVSGIAFNNLKEYPNLSYVFDEFMQMLSVALDPGGQDRIYMVGYGASFDNDFMRKWYGHNGQEELFKSHFHSAPIDIMTLAAKYFCGHGLVPVSYSLQSIARIFKLPVEHGKLHNAAYDAQLARKLYYAIETYVKNGIKVI